MEASLQFKDVTAIPWSVISLAVQYCLRLYVSSILTMSLNTDMKLLERDVNQNASCFWCATPVAVADLHRIATHSIEVQTNSRRPLDRLKCFCTLWSCDLDQKNIILEDILKVIPRTKFEDFGIIRFRVKPGFHYPS